MVTLRIPRVLQQQSDGKAEIPMCACSVRELLEQLGQSNSALHHCICDETGCVRQHINLFLNDKLLRSPTGLDTQLEAGDVVCVFQAVSGG